MVGKRVPYRTFIVQQLSLHTIHNNKLRLPILPQNIYLSRMHLAFSFWYSATTINLLRLTRNVIKYNNFN